MSRRKRRRVREEHHNHEAWVIPYADLLTLLLAFFVVLYAVSSVNEGKYRVLSNTLFAEFRGTPRSMHPVQVGSPARSEATRPASGRSASLIDGHPAAVAAPPGSQPEAPQAANPPPAQPATTAAEAAQLRAQRALGRIADEVTQAMGDLIREQLVVVHRHHDRIEVEIRADILYPSGSATLSPAAVGVIERLAAALRRFPNSVRVEGHTDDRPINTTAFPSNWELSSARAARVVHLLASSGVDPSRLSVVGRAQFSPVQPNSTPEGRNANRRVLIVIQSYDGSVPAVPGTGTVPAP